MRGRRHQGWWFAVLGAALVAACGPAPSSVPTGSASPPPETPTAAPTAAAAQPSRPPTPRPTLPPTGGESPGPTATDGQSVGRTSFDMTVTYDVKAAITVSTGALEVTTLLRVHNDSGEAIDRLELNTLAAKLGGIRIIEATVDDTPVKVVVDDQTLRVPLGLNLEPGHDAAVRIGYRARLQAGLADPAWLFSRSGGTLVLYRWIPWVSRAMPFDRPNQGDPYLLPASPRVDVEIVTDEPMILAAPTDDVVKAAVGRGGAWAFTLEDVRDVSIVLAADLKVTSGEASGVPIRVYAPAGSPNRDRLLALARQAVSGQSRLLGMDFPRPMLAVVETEGGEALESPGLIWIPRTESSLNREYLVHHAVAHQWFYGLVGSDGRNEPFADEGPADFLARSVLNNFRASRCPTAELDLGIGRYSRTCYYEVMFVQAGLLLDDIRRRMGDTAFWSALRGYVEAHRLGLSGTKDLLDTLVGKSDANLRPLLRARFPSLY